MKRYSVFITPDYNIDTVVLYLEFSDLENEVIFVNRLLDYVIVKSNNPRTLWVKGVIEVTEDPDL